MSKLFYLFVLGMIAYYLLKSFFFAPRRPTPKAAPEKRDLTFEGEGEMVEDPVCGTYVDSAAALSVNLDGKKVYFCSETCRQEFQARQSNRQ